PCQIDTVNSFFTPNMKEIRYALRVLKSLEEGMAAHKGAVTLDGGMIDKPMELRARTTLAQAKAAGIDTEGMVV
ncbi:MAG: citrate lyase subunit beta, partial [Lachnospiraceae bacterium]|nr:citrate lyase subunit beta [Lachnospiraceae bacterium]